MSLLGMLFCEDRDWLCPCKTRTLVAPNNDNAVASPSNSAPNHQEAQSCKPEQTHLVAVFSGKAAKANSMGVAKGVGNLLTDSWLSRYEDCHAC